MPIDKLTKNTKIQLPNVDLDLLDEDLTKEQYLAQIDNLRNDYNLPISQWPNHSFIDDSILTFFYKEKIEPIKLVCLVALGYNNSDIQQLIDDDLEINLPSYSPQEIEKINKKIQDPEQKKLIPLYDHNRFNLNNIIKFLTIKSPDPRKNLPPITPDIANKYNYRFDADDILELWIGKTTPKDIDLEYKNNQLINVIDNRYRYCGPIWYKEANNFNYIFKTQDIIDFHANQISGDLSKNYIKKNNNTFCITELIKNSIPSYIYKKYDEARFNYSDIISLYNNKKTIKTIENEKMKTIKIQDKILPDDANNYWKHFKSQDIINLYNNDISREKANEYPKYLETREIIYLRRKTELFDQKAISWLQVKKYPENYPLDDIIFLYNNWIYWDTVKKYKYKDHFTVHNILYFEENNFPSNIMNEYDERFLTNTILTDNIDANDYTIRSIIKYMEITTNKTIEYSFEDNQNIADIINLYTIGFLPKDIKKYKESFNIYDIFYISLLPKNWQDEANSFNNIFTGYDILCAYTTEKFEFKYNTSNNIICSFNKDVNKETIYAKEANEMETNIFNLYAKHWGSGNNLYTWTDIITLIRLEIPLSFIEKQINQNRNQSLEKIIKLRNNLSKTEREIESIVALPSELIYKLDKLDFITFFNLYIGGKELPEYFGEIFNIDNLYEVDPPIYSNFKSKNGVINKEKILQWKNDNSNKKNISNYENISWQIHTLTTKQPLKKNKEFPLFIPLWFGIKNIFLINKKWESKSAILWEDIILSKDKNWNYTIKILTKRSDLKIEIANLSETNWNKNKQPWFQDKEKLFNPEFNLGNISFENKIKQINNPDEIALLIKEYIQSIWTYWFNTEIDKKYRWGSFWINSWDYLQNMFDVYKENWEMVMICNQSALLTIALLREYWIPARLAQGLAGWQNELWWVPHARAEYRDGKKRVELDATPSKISKYDKYFEKQQIAIKTVNSNYTIENKRKIIYPAITTEEYNKFKEEKEKNKITNLNEEIKNSISWLKNLNWNLQYRIRTHHYDKARDYFYTKSTATWGIWFIERINFLKQKIQEYKNSNQKENLPKYKIELQNYEKLKNKYDIRFQLYDKNNEYYFEQKNIFKQKLKKKFMLNQQKDFKQKRKTKKVKFLLDEKYIDLTRPQTKYEKEYSKFTEYNSFKTYREKEDPFFLRSINDIYPTPTLQEFTDDLFNTYKNNIQATEKITTKTKLNFEKYEL